MQKTIKNYFEYFPSGPHEEALGFQVSSLGRTVVRPGQNYPPTRHPEQNHFSWKTGRVLNAMQLVFVSAGCGEIEWKTGREAVRAGHCLILMPGVWHRYRPDQGRGWTEHWIELKGRLMDEWLSVGVVDPDCGLFRLRRGSRVGAFFEMLHSVVTDGRPGGGTVLAGLALAILAEALRSVDGGRREAISRLVRELQRRLRDPQQNSESIAALARLQGISYPTLLRHFRKETGLNPKEYRDKIRMARAERLLASGELEIKEIAAALRFHSPFHFSSQFSRTHGLSPTAWRREVRGH